MRKSMLKQEFADFKISESEGLHKGYDRFQKLRTLEIDVKGGSSYNSRVPAAPTHSAFISAASTNSNAQLIQMFVKKKGPGAINVRVGHFARELQEKLIQNKTNKSEGYGERSLKSREIADMGYAVIPAVDARWS
ncbi:hypothetical protein Tco_0513465 [Tanacetum coccineum]